MRGLTHDEVAKKQAQGLVNRLVLDDEHTTWEIIRRNTLTFFNLVFFSIALLLVGVGAWNQLTFLPIIVLNALIGIVQEIRAKKVLDQMNLLHASHASVIRDGKVQTILSEDLVQGDLVHIKTGQQVMADARLIEGTLAVNESLLTGESDDIDKQTGDFLLSGSFVVTGQGYIQLEAVGKESYISQLSMEAKAMNVEEQSAILKALNKVLTYVSYLIVPIALILFSQSFFLKGHSLQESVVSTVSAIIGMIPEGLYLLTTLALTMSTVALARKKVLLHSMKSIEALAHVDTLCVDKTGTITEPNMQVISVLALSQSELTDQEAQELVSRYSLASTDDNETMKAIRRYVASQPLSQVQTVTPLEVLPFTSTAKLGGIQWQDGIYLLGAPEFVLRDTYEHYLVDFQDYLSAGKRVLVLAQYEAEHLYLPLDKPAIPLAILILENPIRENAAETFAYFTQQGVDLKVISGDNPTSVSQIAQQAGIHQADQWIDAQTLHTDQEYDRAVRDYTVFGRVTPEQKRLLVQALHRADRTVAMTGDGVNDILAMKEADCSIAMSSGSEAATQVAQVVLLDNDFDRMRDVLHEGRRVVNNVQRSSTLFLVKNLYSILMALLSIFFVLTFPIKASQLSLISAFTIGIPGFLLSLEPNTKKIQKNFLRSVIFKALPASLTSVFASLVFLLVGYFFSLSSEATSTATIILMALVGFMIIIEISLPMNHFKWGVVLLNLLGFTLASLLLSKVFAMTPIPLLLILLVFGLTFVCYLLYRVLDRWSMAILKKYST